MLDESALAKGAVWALVKITVVPVDPRREVHEIKAGVEVCPPPDPGDAVGSWAVELHAEQIKSASLGSRTCRRDRILLGQGSEAAVPKDSYYNEVAFRSAGALTHVKARCATWNGAQFSKAAKLPEAAQFMPGDRARVEIHVFRSTDAPGIGRPSVEFFEEPVPAPVSAPALGAPRLAQAMSETLPAFQVVVFETAQEQAQGLQDRPFIEPDTLFVFPYIRPGTVFHSRNVREPFDLAFLAFDNIVLEKRTIHPTQEVAVAPQGTWTAIEARAGWMDYWKFLPGYKIEIPSRG